jgi:hypothetical protein
VAGNWLIAWRLEGWEAERPEAMKPLSLQASKLSSLPAILTTPDTMDIVRFKELNRTKISHVDFATYLLDTI